MTLSKGRTFLGILSLIITCITTYLLFIISGKTGGNSQFYISLFPSIVSLFNVVILLGWMAFEGFGGIALTIFAIAISSWLMLRADLYANLVFVLPFFITTFVGYGYLRMKLNLGQLYVLRSEKLDEEINVLFNNIKKNKLYITSLEDKLRRYSSLKQVAETLSTDLSLEDITTLIIRKTIDTLGIGGRLLLFMVDIKKEELTLSASKDVSKIKTKKGDIFDYWVLRHRKSLIIEDVTKDFRFPVNDIEEAKGHFRSLIEVPLISENKVIGILRMDSLAASQYTHDDLRLLDIISDLGAVAIENALLYAKTQELAIKDGLTGLAVRRYFMERFKEELKRAARKKEELSFLILDIDHFKDYNDRYGHAVGDLVLKHLSRIISSMVKEDDLLGRYGGEEIALLLFNADKCKASLEAEAIRKRIEEEPLIVRKNELHITVSVGVSSYPEDAMLEEELIKIADERLYKAKKSGRNKVCVN